MLLHSGAGGSGVVATELALHLARRGHDVHVVANAVPFRLAGALQERISFHQIASMPYPLFEAPLTTLSEANTLVDVVERFGVDVIHAHYAIPHAAAAILAREMVHTPSTPGIVTTLHGTDVTLVGLDRAYLRATQWSIERSDVVTAVSHDLARMTVTDLGVRRHDVEVVHNSVDHERFARARPLMPRERLARPDEKIIMHVSNFRAVKRPSDVVRVFATIAQHIPSRLILVGDGPETSASEAVARELGVDDRVRFLGSDPRVEALLCLADLFLLPSAQESFGLTALEAMAAGVPVIASNVGGLPEVVLHGVTGWLHDVGDVAAMSASAIELFTDAARYAVVSKAASDRARLDFGEERAIDRYLQLYDAAIERARRARPVHPSA